jgi:mRNA-degrading endonuclease HigB of HigAB toxin-antitoxin module
MALRMRVVGRERLVMAIDADEVPAAPARAWFAETLDARWGNPHDVMKRFKDAEEVDASTILVPLDGAEHCVVVSVSYECGVAVIAFAGKTSTYRTRRRRRSGRA